MKTRYLLLAFLLILVSFGSGYAFGRKGYFLELKQFPGVNLSREIPTDKKLDFSLFWGVWDLLEASYFDKSKLVPTTMVYGAIEGMVRAVGDPYTVFLPPEENKVIQEDLSGNFEGVGIQIGFKGTQLVVIAPLPNTPAEKAGIKAGDFIVGIKDEQKKIDRSTVGINLPDAVQAIRGPKGSKVVLILLREDSDEPIETEVIREAIDVPSVLLSFVGDDKSIAYLQLLKFGGETEDEWDREVREILQKPGLQGMIFDVRNNPGGYLQGAVDIASEFLKEGTVVIEENAEGRKNEFKVNRRGRLTEIPLVVLVNRGSASASEILAGALKDYHRATIVGETTFGKGTIQESQPVDSKAALHITIARWLTPSGFWINEEGLEPNVKIKNDFDTAEDEQLQEAINILERNQ